MANYNTAEETIICYRIGLILLISRVSKVIICEKEIAFQSLIQGPFGPCKETTNPCEYQTLSSI